MSVEDGQRLSDAAYSGDLAQLGTLLESGISVNTCDTDGFTALHRSCVTGRLDVIKFLIEHDADVNAEDSYGDSPMHYACFCGHVDAVHMLLEAGADPEKPSKDGKTPIESAREEGHEAVVRLLTSPGAGGGGGGSSVAGLDFSRGVIIEGELKKKRANLVVKWRKKYYVFSRVYGAMFFWTGTKSTVEGVIKKVRFETFLSVRQLEKYGGRRFDIRVITGRRMRLLASTAGEAKRWVDTIKQHLGHLMAVIRVQTAWRVYRARKTLRRMIAERQAAVKRMVASSAAAVAGSGSGSGGGGVGVKASPDGILYEGPLRKKNSKGIGRMFTAFRTRYFVLNIHDAALYYYESKAKRTVGVRPRAIPLLSFYSVRQLFDKRGKPTKKFHLRVVSGRVFEFEGKAVDDVSAWVANLLAVLPRDNVAAVKIQSIMRMKLAKTRVGVLKAEAEDSKAVFASTFGTDYGSLETSAVKIQAAARGRAVRVKAAKDKAAKEEAEKKLADVKARRVWLRKRNASADGEAGAGADGSVPDASGGGAASESTAARLRRLKALKKKKAKKAWTAHVDEATGQTYWHNVDTDESTWEDPTVSSDDEGPPPSSTSEERKSAPATPRPDGPASTSGTTEWDVANDEEGNLYYVNRASGESVWEEPDGFLRWIEEVDPESGKPYFFNRVTKESSWERPRDFVKVIGDWEERTDDEGTLYYFHRVTGESVWEKPAEFGVVKAAVVEAGGDDSDIEGSDSDAENWREEHDPSTNRSYWYNTVTHESSWTKPDKKSRKKKKGKKGGKDDDEEEETEDLLDMSEVLAFSSWVNLTLNNGEGGRGGGHLPLDLEVDSPQLVHAVRSGVLLCQLINAVVPGTIDERVITLDAEPGVKEEGATASSAGENLQLALSAAQSIGAVLGTVTVDDLEAGNGLAVMDTIWQIMKIHLMSCFNVKRNLETGSGKNLIRLIAADEELSDFLQLTPDKVLVRWVNYQLEAAGSTRHIDSVGQSLADGVALAALVRHVSYEYAADIPATEDEAAAMDPAELVTHVLGAAFGAGVPAWFSVEAVTAGNMRLQLAFLASLFRVAPSLASASGDGGDGDGSGASAASASATSAGAGAGAGASAGASPGAGSGASARRKARKTVSSVQVAKLEAELADLVKEEEAGSSDSRESRTMKQWLNSLNLPQVYVHDLFQDVRDGVILLKTLDHVEPGIVNWRKASKPKSPDKPLNRYRRVENCNYVIDLAKAMELTLVNVAGLDLVDGNAKLALAILWQMMRYHTLKILSTVGDGFEMAEEDIVEWANAQVAAEAETSSGKSGTVPPMKSFQDSSLSNGLFLMHLLNSVRGIVNWDLVTKGRTDKERQTNAQYLISVARKMGAAVFCTWEDIVAVRPKMLMMFVASVMVVNQQREKAASAGGGGGSGGGGSGAAAGAGGALETVGEEAYGEEEYDSD